MIEVEVEIPAGDASVKGNLRVPGGAAGIVVFAHGSGSGRFSPRNQFVARLLEEAGYATVLIDLLSEAEERIDARTAHLRFDVGLLAERLGATTRWLENHERLKAAKVGYFGASTGAAAALIAAATRPHAVAAVVSRGGRPDLAGDDLPRVRAPTLLIVGGNDEPVIELNRRALDALTCTKQLEIVPGATHLFEEPGALEEVARLAAGWFRRLEG